jgi:G:T-mismatch repair DNA endonuclease (very short patch repair protein)
MSYPQKRQPNHNKDYNKDIRDRLTRIETRLTKFMYAQGFDTQGTRARWQGDGVIQIPSIDVTLRECIATVPKGYTDSILVKIEDDEVMEFFLPDAG